MFLIGAFAALSFALHIKNVLLSQTRLAARHNHFHTFRARRMLRSTLASVYGCCDEGR
jgi:hypothetical protein